VKDAYERGYDAYLDGKRRRDNPETGDKIDWDCGWCDAKKDVRIIRKSKNKKLIPFK